jgi:hypothetical protein
MSYSYSDATNGGVPRHLAKSIGFVFSNPDAISEMIKDEQIKSQGLSICEFPWTYC